jgi:signal transduction histidine kinase
MLEGERSHVQASLARLPQGRRVQAQALLDPAGRVVASTGLAGLPVQLPADAAGASAALEWSGSRVWVTARAPIQRAGTTIAWLVLGTSLQPMVEVLFPSHAGLRVSFGDPAAVAADAGRGNPAEARPPAFRLPTSDPARPLPLHLESEDVLLPARDKVLALLRWALPLSATVLGGVLAVGLLWQLVPLRQIGVAARRVGQGDLHPPLPQTRLAELAVVVDAFEQMLRDLRAYESLRTQSEQQQRLQTIGRMAARVAHDINNPLTVIQTHLSLLQRGAAGSDPTLRESIDKMQHHCARCRRTVELLLQYGRPVRLHGAWIDLGALCREAAGRTEQQRAPQQVQVDDRSAGVRVWADALHLEQVLDNLLANACDAAPGATVQLQVHADPEGVDVRVVDQGPGFTTEAIGHAFEPFFTTKRNGTGLGLASCLAIVIAHGGRMRILRDDDGAGVAFWLPRHPPNEVSTNGHQAAAPLPLLRPAPATPATQTPAGQG